MFYLYFTSSIVFLLILMYLCVRYHWICQDLRRMRVQVWSNSSLAVCELRASTELRAYRNGKRPLYLIQTPGMVLVTSTADIARRAGLSHEPAWRIPMNTVVTITGELSPHLAMPEPTTLRDLQYATGH